MPPGVFTIPRGRRIPLSDNKYKFGALTVVMLVALRLTIGCHFFYEGVWKINDDDFTVKPLLTAAKGPFAPLFHSMIPDLDGQVRLALTEVEEENDDGKVVKRTVYNGEVYLNAWTEAKDEFVAAYDLNEAQTAEVDLLFTRYKESLEEYSALNEDDIKAYLGALTRLEERTASGDNEAKHEKKRLWDAKMKLRREADGFLTELDAMGAEFCLGLWNVLEDTNAPQAADEEANQEAGEEAEPQAPAAVKPSGGALPEIVTAPEKLPVSIPCCDTQVEFLTLAISYSLAAIGLCLLLGFCTRPACIGGGLFLITVLMNQPPWPSIYPPAPPVVGHSMIVDKNFVEMMAIFALATIPVGRWAGLDYFCHHWIGRRICGFFSKKV